VAGADVAPLDVAVIENVYVAPAGKAVIVHQFFAPVRGEDEHDPPLVATS